MFAAQAIVAVLSGAARYPSGLDPALCPNYPHCDNALLAAYAQPAAGHANVYYGGVDEDDDSHRYNGAAAAGHYGSGYQQHAGAYRHHHHQPAPYTEPGYPAGLSSSNCPNYPYCSHQVPAEALRYAGPNKRYPAGVTPQNCPNYPYCY